MNIIKKYWLQIFVSSTLIFGIFLRLYKIDFGLPYSFIADETDIYYDVIRYALNYKFIHNLQEFAPTSYVYGMFPTYFLTLSTMVLNKLASIFRFSIDFNFYFIFMRIVTSIFSMLEIIFSTLIFKKLFRHSKGFLITVSLTALNWKLIAHSHYLNHDTYLMVLSTISLYFLVSYFEENNTKKRLMSILLSSIFFGLGVGTKITALITLPIILFCIIQKKDLKNAGLYVLGVILSFSISNPFSIINFSSFFSRLILMRSVEAGIVFNSVNTNPLKYIFSLSQLLTPPILIISLIGIYLTLLKVKKVNLEENLPHVALIGYVLTYILFFSLNPRLIDRWMLPILPILIIYATYGLIRMREASILKNRRTLKVTIIIGVMFIYLIYPISLLNQLKIGKPRVNAYLWAREYFSKQENKNTNILMYSNKPYKDPFRSIDGCQVEGFNVYESKGAGNSYPLDLSKYDFVIVYSSMQKSYKNKYVINKYPDYYKSWLDFENTLTNPDKFELIGSFKTTKLNLLDIPDIFIYKKVI